MIRNSSRAGLSLIELLALLTVMALLVGMLIPTTTRRKAKAGRIKCVNNLKNIGLAFRIFANDNGDRFPQSIMISNGVVEASLIDALRVFRCLSNELSTPNVLYCPEDKKRKAAESFTNLTSKNISYFVSLTAKETKPQSFLAGDRNLQTNGITVPPGLLALKTNTAISWSKEIHLEQGDIVMGDGSVQQMSSSRLRLWIPDQASGTNYLAIP